jgi:hypothetical protein
MVFERRALVEVEALVSAERSCCGWARWSVRPRSDSIEVEVAGPASEVAALADSFGV